MYSHPWDRFFFYLVSFLGLLTNTRGLYFLTKTKTKILNVIFITSLL
ncbi:similar to EF hand domain containing 1 (predicted), isoform CRA_b [Rattus norvegicus]|uniref:Similar to EF hand domain containing 1 (Predicted), isoform CRA_b n=1 Tax=Rattus norvegicus TaxID=10116 RepID=A6JWM2_RAT|nr:similar to EF hand domain containing 1 (predicted), isoform CRA_b [Rattus norvegicus]